MRSNTKQALLVTVVGVTLFVALLRLSDVLAFAAQLVDLVLPILAGGILALFLSVPMAGLEKRLGRLFAKARKQPSGKALHLLSFLLTLLGVVLVLVLALTLLIPELVQSFHSLYLQIEANIPRWTAYLHAQDPDMGWLMSRLEGIDWEQLLHKVTSGLDTVLVNAAGAVSATVNLVVTASFALIISVYLSLGAQSLGHQARTLVRAYLKPGHAAWVLKFCRLFRQSFANFLTGQCSEAVILGMLMSLAFSLFRIPYGSLVGMLTAICAIIPYVGALLSCVISVFLVLLVDPLLAVRALLVYLAVQFIENQFIYPRVVGKSVGLSPLYTLVAAMIGGKLFGILGILFFIPLTAVLLDVLMPNLDGFAVCRAVREGSGVPILFLTALGGEKDVLRGYALGADDYVTKPFSLAVLLAKTEALIRRSRGGGAETLACGAITLEPGRRACAVGGRPVALPPREYELLLCLMRNKGQVLRREQLLDKVWGIDFEGGDRAVDGRIKALRAALGPAGKQIRTVFKVGYKLEEGAHG